jgi:nitroreductase
MHAQMGLGLKSLARLLIGRMRIRVRLCANYLYDLRRFQRSAGLGTALDREMLQARIAKDYHRLEKGLALANPRPGFGSDVVARLLTAVPRFEQSHGACHATAAARGALTEYVAFHRDRGTRFPDIEALLTLTPPGGGSTVTSGTVSVRRVDIHADAAIDFLRFASSRHSVRQFTGEPVSAEYIEQAIAAAMRSPSVCNRQTCRVHAATGAERMRRALGFQNGNRGFGDRAGAVLVLTSDMRGFTTIGERNQCWIDGGLFAMSLAYAFHAQGFGTCMLNWSMERTRDLEMRRALGIPDHESVILMMAIGVMPEEFSVARSPRRPLGEVLRICASQGANDEHAGIGG